MGQFLRVWWPSTIHRGAHTHTHTHPHDVRSKVENCERGVGGSPRGWLRYITMMMEKGASVYIYSENSCASFHFAKKILDKRFPNKLMVFRLASLIVDSVSLCVGLYIYISVYVYSTYICVWLTVYRSFTCTFGSSHWVCLCHSLLFTSSIIATFYECGVQLIYRVDVNWMSKEYRVIGLVNAFEFLVNKNRSQRGEVE